MRLARCTCVVTCKSNLMCKVHLCKEQREMQRSSRMCKVHLCKVRVCEWTRMVPCAKVHLCKVRMCIDLCAGAQH